MAFPIAAVLGGLSLVQNFLAQKDANSARDRALSIEEQKAQLDAEQQRKLIDQYDQIQKIVNGARMKGVYDPNLWAKNFGDQFQKGAEVITKRQNRELDARGYKPTDSEFKYRTDKLDRTLNHDLAVGQMGARQNAVAAEAGAMQLGNPSLGMSRSFTPSSTVPQMLLNQAEANTPDWGAGIGAMIKLIQAGQNKPPTTGQSIGHGLHL